MAENDRGLFFGLDWIWIVVIIIVVLLIFPGIFGGGKDNCYKDDCYKDNR